jgi:DNA-binding protein Fis
MIPSVYAIPAFIALIAKVALFFYARSSRIRNLETRLYLLFLFALSIQNVVEILGFQAIARRGFFPDIDGFVYYSAGIMAIALVFDLALTLSRPSNDNQIAKTRIILYAPAVVLEILLWYTPWLVVGFESHGYTAAKMPGPLYFLYEIYAVGYLGAVVAFLAYGSRRQETSSSRLKNKLLLLGMLPIFFVVVAVVLLAHFGVRHVNVVAINTSVTLPLAVTFFLAVTAYAIHQHRLFDIQFYIPWSKVRKRKTAFYRRIRGMIAEIANLSSVNEAVSQLAHTLGCPVALVDSKATIVAASGAQDRMIQIPQEALLEAESIIVTNEIKDVYPETYMVMKRHGVAAVVPFYPHSRNASGWLLLGDSFSEHVYTPLDFRLVEELFDKMADLFLDKLLTMRAQLAEANKQMRLMQRQVEKSESMLAPLQRDVETLRRENMRLLKEQRADSLGRRRAETSARALAATVTLLARDKPMGRRLRQHFPQTAHFVGPDSIGFRRKSLPDVLVAQVESGTSAAESKLLKLATENRGRVAILLYGSGANEFGFKHKKELLGSLIQLMPREITEEALVRTVYAIAELRKAVFAVHDPNCPLIARSQAFSHVLAEARRLAGLMEPVLISTTDIQQAVALANYMYEASNQRGRFKILRVSELEQAVNHGDDFALPLDDCESGTLMIDDLSAASSVARSTLIAKITQEDKTRMIAACSGDAREIAARLRAINQKCDPLLIDTPNMRERKADIQPLVHYYTLQFNLQTGSENYLRQTEVDELMAEEFPASVSALKASVFRRLQSKQERPPEAADLDYDVTNKSLDEHVSEFEARLIVQTLKRCDGNKSKTARLLGLRPNTLHYKLERYGLSGPNKKRGQLD